MNRLRPMTTLLVAIGFALAALPAAAAAAPGDLDPTFGSGGVTSLSTNTQLYGVAVQPDREVVAVGYSGTSVLVERFSASGSPEGAFAAGSGVGRAVVLQGDGKIVVAGEDSAGMLVERFNSNGTLDTSFGSQGIVHAVPGSRANAVALGPNGTIVAAGQVPGTDGFQRVAILRLNSSGAPDTTLGSGGVHMVDLGQDSIANGVAVQPDGKIVIAGSIGPGTQRVTNAFVARLNSSGALDSTFGSNGQYVLFPQAGGAEIAFNAVTLDPAGGIVLGGAGTTTNQSTAVFGRLTCAGQPDHSFAGSGLELVPSSRNFASSAYGANGVAVVAGRRVVGAGQYQDSGLSEAALWGFESGGSPDFANNAPLTAQASALAVDSAGDLVVAGSNVPAGFPPSGFVARYTGFGAPATGSTPCGASSAPPPPPPSGASQVGLMGRMGFVSPGGVVGVDVGCFNGTTSCTGQIQMSYGGSVVGQRNFSIAPESGGFQDFGLSSPGRRLLAGNRLFHLLKVDVTVKATNGPEINRVMSLARWVWGNGSGNAHSVTPAVRPVPPNAGTSRIGLMGGMGFVSPGGVIGVEVGCFNGHASCAGHITMTHNGVIVGQRDFSASPESGGYQNLGLSPEGRRLLGENRTFRLLGVDVTIRGTNGQTISEVMHLAQWVWH